MPQLDHTALPSGELLQCADELVAFDDVVLMTGIRGAEHTAPVAVTTSRRRRRHVSMRALANDRRA